MASALSGVYSGSSIANTVTTGTFTIPLMKRTGFSPEKAGAVEVASSTNGQLTPPVMGAAAFLIAEFTGISYTEIIKHALVPAAGVVHRAGLHRSPRGLKLGLKGLPKATLDTMTFATKLIGFLSGFIGHVALLGMIGLLRPRLGQDGHARACFRHRRDAVRSAAYLILVFLAWR